MSTSRVGKITNDLISAIGDICKKHQITHSEYRKAIDFISQAIDQGERSLLFDAFLEANVVSTDPERSSGTSPQVLGPFYLPNMPWLENGVLATDNEPGERMTLSGQVLGQRREPVKNAELDFWQADAKGRYSNFDPGAQDGNLRGKIRSDENGNFALKTIRPAQYTIPDQGPTGLLLREIGRHSWRPAHFHVIVRHPDYKLLTTQIYFEGDKYVTSDAVQAASTDLAFPVIPTDEGSTLNFDIILQEQ